MPLIPVPVTSVWVVGVEVRIAVAAVVIRPPTAAKCEEATTSSKAIVAEIAMAREEWQLLLAGQPEHYQEILLALRDGRTQQDVARQLGVNERTVRRVLRKLAPGKPHDAR